jgi:hypothetical protein
MTDTDFTAKGAKQGMKSSSCYSSLYSTKYLLFTTVLCCRRVCFLFWGCQGQDPNWLVRYGVYLFSCTVIRNVSLRYCSSELIWDPSKKKV